MSDPTPAHQAPDVAFRAYQDPDGSWSVVRHTFRRGLPRRDLTIARGLSAVNAEHFAESAQRSLPRP